MTPRTLVLRGRQPIGAWAFPKGHEDRLVGAWTPGAKAWDLGDRWLLELPRPQEHDVETAIGQPFVRDRAWLDFPLTERERLPQAADEVIDVHHGVIRRVVATTEAPVADWLDLSDLVRLDAHPLGDPPRPPALDLPSATAALAARGFGRTDEVQAALAALRSGGSWLSRPLGWAARAFLSAREALPTPTGPGWLQRADAWLGRASMALGLGAVMGARWGRFLDQMVARFDTDLLGALKYAIPLGGAGMAGAGLGLGWMLPNARAGLGFGGGGPGRAINFQSDLYAQLQRMYRRAFEKLDQMGRVDEAAWVLAELLGEVGEALVYLEKHQKYAMAADLAEAKGQPVALVLRLRWLAGDPERAIALASLHRAFADAIARSEPALARLIRQAWGRSRVAVGDLVGAVDILAEDPELRGEAAIVLETGVAAGGTLEARLLPRRFALHPDGADTLARARAILDAAGPEADVRRQHLVAAAISRDATGGWSDLLARRIVRAGFAHPALAAVPHPRVHDAALVHDLSRVSRPPPAAGSAPNLAFDPFVGGGVIEDLAAVGDGRLLVARGELGAALLDATGAVVRRWDVPAHAIVVGEHRALLLAIRERWVAITRVNLDTGACQPWAELAITNWADRFDEVWFVATEQAVLALDAVTAKGVWRVETGRPHHLHAGRDWLSFSAHEAGAPTWFRYERPSLTLRDRTEPTGDAVGAPTTSWQTETRRLLVTHDGERSYVNHTVEDRDLRLLAVSDDARAVVLLDAGALAMAQTGEGIELSVWMATRPPTRAATLSTSTSRIRTHLHHDTWTLTARGEAVAITLPGGGLARRLRDA